MFLIRGFLVRQFFDSLRFQLCFFLTDGFSAAQQVFVVSFLFAREFFFSVDQFLTPRDFPTHVLVDPKFFGPTLRRSRLLILIAEFPKARAGKLRTEFVFVWFLTLFVGTRRIRRGGCGRRRRCGR